MDWIKQHTDTAILLITFMSYILGSVLWMNGKFNELEKELTIIRTVLVVKGIYPNELCKNEDHKNIIKDNR